jgi:hypothetical protein
VSHRSDELIERGVIDAGLLELREDELGAVAVGDDPRERDRLDSGCRLHVEVDCTHDLVDRDGDRDLTLPGADDPTIRVAPHVLGEADGPPRQVLRLPDEPDDMLGCDIDGHCLRVTAHPRTSCPEGRSRRHPG